MHEYVPEHLRTETARIKLESKTGITKEGNTAQLLKVYILREVNA